MKIIGTFGVVVIASMALLQPAEGRGSRGGGGRSFSSGHHFSGSARNFSGGGARYSSSAGARHRAYSPSSSGRRYSSQPGYRHRTSRPQSAINRTAALNPRRDSASNARLAPGRRTAQRAQGFNNGQARIAAQHTRNWNRNRDHNWRGNRCRWRNNYWVVIGPWYPWGYGYFPYASYSYYDDRYYDDRYASDEYQSEYDDGDGNISVTEVQSALARAGYYHGEIDGSVGPATRNALRRFQRDRGLDATGQIDQSVIQALRLR